MKSDSGRIGMVGRCMNGLKRVQIGFDGIGVVYGSICDVNVIIIANFNRVCALLNAFGFHNRNMGCGRSGRLDSHV